VRPLACSIYDASVCKTLILKLGVRGVLTCTSSDHENLESFFVIDSFADNVVDAVGAGDALLAYATLSLMSHESTGAATILGSIAAACECAFDGNRPVTPNDVRKRIDNIESAIKFEQ